MFILYAVPIGLAAGFLVGGRPAGLAAVRFQHGWVMLAGLLVQVALFSPPVAAVIGDAGPPIYVASTGAVILAILANLRITGMPIVAVGAISNITAIVANGGYMPADPGAMAALGRSEPTDYSNSALLADPVFRPLTDIFAMPGWLPFANVFSIGDVIIALGVVTVIVVAMRRPGATAVAG
jgi:Family of unknown function (DUF5317)